MRSLSILAMVPIVGAAGLLTACGEQQTAAPSGAPRIGVEASDSACTLASSAAPAGVMTFDIHNTGTKVTEFYLYGPGDKIVSEAENIGPGTSRQLVVQADGGSYAAACKPGMSGGGIRAAFNVTGKSAAATTGSTAPGSPGAATGSVAQGVDAYKKYVAEQAEQLEMHTGEFTEAVKAGRVEDAKRLYPQARVHWERIEPVAESFGELDAKIDKREGDLQPGEQWSGYHRLEKQLWAGGLEPESAELADELDEDVKEIAEKAKTVDLPSTKAANGAKELLDEVATKKVTGEEEPFSHTDLWDFKANVDGAKQVIESFRPVVQAKDPKLLAQLDQKFAAVNALLARYQRADGFAPYTDLKPDQVKELGASVDALGEPLSKTGAAVAG